LSGGKNCKVMERNPGRKLDSKRGGWFFGTRKMKKGKIRIISDRSGARREETETSKRIRDLLGALLGEEAGASTKVIVGLLFFGGGVAERGGEESPG